eukprot:19118-Chlamydomonas_euryale.AAC.3
MPGSRRAVAIEQWAAAVVISRQEASLFALHCCHCFLHISGWYAARDRICCVAGHPCQIWPSSMKLQASAEKHNADFSTSDHHVGNFPLVDSTTKHIIQPWSNPPVGQP